MSESQSGGEERWEERRAPVVGDVRLEALLVAGQHVDAAGTAALAAAAGAGTGAGDHGHHLVHVDEGRVLERHVVSPVGLDTHVDRQVDRKIGARRATQRGRRGERAPEEG